MARLRVVKSQARARFGDVDGVQGFGIGDRRLRIYVRTASIGRTLPSSFEGVPVECVEVGDVEASAT
jgi:hypothetical protein